MRAGAGGPARRCYDATMEIIERPTTTPVTLTESAAQKIRQLMADDPEGDATVLRVAIQVCASYGFQY